MEERATTLSALRPGETTLIGGYDPSIEDHLKDRLLVLGFVPGTQVTVIRCAPLGDPVEFELRGTRVSLRRSEASLIMVQPA